MTDSHETMGDAQFVRRLLSECEAGRRYVLASVLATRGSMPRHAGARMALLEDGGFVGTVGGGRVEQLAQERSLRVMAGEEDGFLAWLTHEETGMACGGDALVAVRASGAPEQEARFLRDEILSRLAAEESFVLTERWDRPAAVRLEVTGVGELAEDDPRAVADAPRWDEDAHAYVEPLGPDPVAYLFGAGHVGAALAPVLASVGFRVVVFDDRPEMALPARFPTAERVVCGDFTDIGSVLKVTRRDYVVVLTHGHAADIDVLEQVSGARPAYVGCIGSRRKAAFARQSLEERGVAAAWADAVHLPIGEDILAVTPAEIAVSIAAQMIRCRAELRPERPHATGG